jgi:riboflavin kinase/FMN adenylyltransferase
VIILSDFGEVPPEARGAVLTVGNFDGVHRGHAHLIGRLRARADALGAPAIALTFDPPPVAILRPDGVPPGLTWPQRRIDLLREVGATEVGVFRTGRWLLGLTAREFFDRIVLRQFAAKGMVEGPTFGFGRDRGGDAQVLGTWCAEAGLELEIVSPTLIDGEIVSSSRVRQALAEGGTTEAATMLGRPHRLRGTVVQGEGRGRRLGIPTANLDGIDVLIPADGVYAGRAFLEGRNSPQPAAIHIGTNVTFGARRRTVEAHLIDFDGDLYGQTIELDLLDRLRSTIQFPGMDALLNQLRTDIAQARALSRA